MGLFRTTVKSCGPQDFRYAVGCLVYHDCEPLVECVRCLSLKLHGKCLSWHIFANEKGETPPANVRSRLYDSILSRKPPPSGTFKSVNLKLTRLVRQGEDPSG